MIYVILHDQDNSPIDISLAANQTLAHEKVCEIIEAYYGKFDQAVIDNLQELMEDPADLYLLATEFNSSFDDDPSTIIVETHNIKGIDC